MYQTCVSSWSNLPKFCWSCLTGLTHLANSVTSEDCKGAQLQGNLKYALYEPFIYWLKLYAVALFIYEKNETALYRQ